MDTAAQLPTLEFNLCVQLGDTTQAGRYTLTGLSPGEEASYVFKDAQSLTQYLEWVALGSPHVH